jgi:hypothetical protein
MIGIFWVYHDFQCRATVSPRTMYIPLDLAHHTRAEYLNPADLHFAPQDTGSKTKVCARDRNAMCTVPTAKWVPTRTGSRPAKASHARP